MSTTEYTVEQAKKDTDSLIPVSGERKRAKVSKLIKSILDEGEKMLSVLKSRSKILPFSNIITLRMSQADKEEEVDPLLLDGVHWTVGLAKDYVRFLFGDKLDTGVGLNRDNFDRLATYLCTEKVVLYNADREGYINRAMLGVCSLGIALYRHIVEDMAVVDKCLRAFGLIDEKVSTDPYSKDISIFEHIASLIYMSEENLARLSEDISKTIIEYYYHQSELINQNLQIPYIPNIDLRNIGVWKILSKYDCNLFKREVDKYNLDIAEDILHYHYLFPITE